MSSKDYTTCRCPECGRRWRILADERPDGCPGCGYEVCYDLGDNDMTEMESTIRTICGDAKGRLLGDLEEANAPALFVRTVKEALDTQRDRLIRELTEDER